MYFYILNFIFYFLLGAAAGSFIYVWSRRLLRGEAVTGRSHCEHCGHTLSTSDLIPLLSFVVLRGRCRYCSKKLSWQYPLVEAGTGLLFAALGMKFPLSNFDLPQLLMMVSLLTAAVALITVFITDLTAQAIADQVLWVGAVSALIYRFLVRLNLSGLSFQPEELAYDILGAVGVWLFFQGIRLATKRRGLGDGDPPLGFFAALLVGFPLVLVQIFLTFIIGGGTGVILILMKKKNLKDRIAFGPFLVIATFITLFWGKLILDWYLRFLGV
ncbi:MAG: A24 family peptidase [Patescibacteria group bacterium]|nr:MAG: A24 family peptidase [Patescibacteria group bacterium]